MKKKILCLTGIGLIFISLFVGCKKKNSNDEEIPEPEATWIPSRRSTVSEYLKKLATAPATANIPAMGGYISQNDITVYIPSGLFRKSDGTNYDGMVKCTLYTVVDVDDAIKRRTSTISPQGDLLITSGMFKIEARDTTDSPLSIRTGATYTAEISSTVYNTQDSIFKGKISTTSNGEQIVWERWPSTFTDRGPVGGINSTGIFGLDDLEWCNLDRYMNEFPLTHIYVSLPAGFTSANSEVVIRYTPDKSIAFLPANSNMQKFTTDGSSYKVVKGRELKVLAMAMKNNKYYYKIETIPSIGENHQLNITSMIETDQNGFNSIINNF